MTREYRTEAHRIVNMGERAAVPPAVIPTFG